MKYYEQKPKSFLSGKGFYLVLAFCLVAVGVAAWSAYTAISEFGEAAENLSSNASVAEQVTAPKDDVSVKTPVSSELPVSSEAPESSVQSKQQVTAAKYFVLPVSGDVIKGFSDEKLQYSLTYNDRRMHLGIDIAANAGTAVKASGEGKVVNVSTDQLLGVVVEIDHGNNISGYYCGLAESVKVKSGDTVKGGQVIGAVGNIPSESLDESHLHLEFKKDGKNISPLKLMGLE